MEQDTAQRRIPAPILGGRLDLPVFEPGWVWLCGAGPGDPGLLTLHALNALSQADCVVHDALVEPAVLALARTGAELIHAGKRGGKPSPKQRDISARLVELAARGKRVLRLKGGDPFTFARGSEEAQALVAAQVPFRVIPGITSGIGGLAYAGIPVSDRDLNQAITFITGHAASGALPDTLNWEALAQGSPVLVVYMGLKHFGRISQQLMAAGRDEDEPVAFVSNATTDRQSVVETTLARAMTDAEAHGVSTPVLIVIGQIVKLRAGLDWLGAMAGRELDPDPLGWDQAEAKSTA